MRCLHHITRILLGGQTLWACCIEATKILAIWYMASSCTLPSAHDNPLDMFALATTKSQASLHRLHQRMTHLGLWVHLRVCVRASKMPHLNSVASRKQCKSEGHCWCLVLQKTKPHPVRNTWPRDMTWHDMLTSTVYAFDHYFVFFLLLQCVTKPSKFMRL